MKNEKLKMPSSAYAKLAPFSQREKGDHGEKGNTLSLWERGVRLAQAGEGFLLVFWFLCLGFSAHAVPIISNVELTSLSDDSMVITWTTTNESSSTEILWGSGGLTNIATGSASTSTTVMSGTTKFHYVELKGLYQNTTYQYRIKSGDTVFPPAPWFSPLTFKTLEKPGGEYLFSFAVLNDLRYAVDATGVAKADTQSSRGIPYSKCAAILADEVSNINDFTDPNGSKGVAFTVINGNLVEGLDTSTKKYGDRGETSIKTALELLRNKPSDLTSNIGYKYLPVTGFYDKDKAAHYTTDWITNSFKPLTSNTSIESVYGYVASSKDAESVFNYQFKYKYYNLIFLDSVKKPGDATGLASTEILSKYLTADPNSKTFIFMSYPAYNPLSSDTKDYPVDIPTGEVGGSICVSNHAAFRTLLESYKDSSQNPIVAAVISGHLGDNYNRSINGISYVRQGPALQYPTGYSIYKVYSTGYVKTFYKTKGTDGNNKPYYEYARDCISGEVVSGQNLAKEVLTQFWLGSSSNRNFTFQYAFIPGVSPKVITNCPSSNESAVNLNVPILVTFNKRMSTPSTDWVTINETGGGSVPVTSVSFTDSNQLTLKVTHADFTIDKTYTATVIGTKAKDEGSTTMEANYSFSFNTNGGTKDDAPPTAAIYPLPNNSTTDPFPVLTGIATDSSRVITVEYRFDNTGSWASTEAVLGKFTGVTEVFQIKPTTALSAGSHQVWLRTYDGIGNTSTEGYNAYTFDLVVGDRPTTSSFKVNGNNAYPGDPISSTPKIELKITSINPLVSGRITIGSIQSALTFVKVDTNYYATYEVGTALSDGIYTAIVESFDSLGNATTYEVSSLYVKSAGDATVQGTPLSYPNPFDPGVSTAEIISYTLSKTANIVLTIHDLSGTMIARKTYSSGENGGVAGYNAVAWNGKSDAGDYVGNGIYVFLIVTDGKVVSRGKLTVLKR